LLVVRRPAVRVLVVYATRHGSTQQIAERSVGAALDADSTLADRRQEFVHAEHRGG